jgi:HlyD family secretion protein
MGPAAKEVPEAAAANTENHVRIEDLKSRLGIIDGQLKQIETRAATQAREILESSLSRRNEIEEVRRTLEIARVQLNRNGEILSDTAGRVTEVLAMVGQVLPPGGPLVTMETQDADHTLTSITYLPIADGKKVEPGMQVQITPEVVERQRFGGILGTVVSVSAGPATREGAMSLIGNAEVVAALLSGGGHIEVISRVETDSSTFSQFRWSSSTGPKLRITSGTTTITRIRVEDRAPITYLLPILRTTSGVY